MDTENLINILREIYMVQYVIVAVLSIWRFPEYKNTGLKWFPAIVILTFLIETVGLYTMKVLELPSNVVFYTIFYLFYFLFIFQVFKENLVNVKFKKSVSIMTITFLTFYGIRFVSSDFMIVKQSEIYVLGGFFVIISIVLFYIDLLRTVRVMIVQYNMLFWISVGLLLFFIGYIPIKIVRTEFATKSYMLSELNILHYGLIIIMNICFIVGLLVAKRKYLELR